MRDKDVITPAPWYALGGVGILWAKYVSKRGTYWQERDALVEGVVEKYFQNPESSNKNRDAAVEDIKNILRTNKDEIQKFLDEKGHYNVSKQTIKEDIIKKDVIKIYIKEDAIKEDIRAKPQEKHCSFVEEILRKREQQKEVNIRGK